MQSVRDRDRPITHPPLDLECGWRHTGNVQGGGGVLVNVQGGGSIFPEGRWRHADTMSPRGGACECPRVGAFFKLMTSRGQCPRGGGVRLVFPSSKFRPPPPPGWLATGLLDLVNPLIGLTLRLTCPFNRPEVCVTSRHSRRDTTQQPNRSVTPA